jgi:hypothetical protein
MASLSNPKPIIIVFNPSSYNTGSLITSISCMILGLLCAGAIGFAVWKNREVPNWFTTSLEFHS